MAAPQWEGNQPTESKHRSSSEPAARAPGDSQPRLLLAALAYTLMINLRCLALAGTELEGACTATSAPSC